MKNFIIPETVLISVVEYLQRRPYNEVIKLLSDMQTSIKIFEDKTEVKTEDNKEAK